MKSVPSYNPSLVLCFSQQGTFYVQCMIRVARLQTGSEAKKSKARVLKETFNCQEKKAAGRAERLLTANQLIILPKLGNPIQRWLLVLVFLLLLSDTIEVSLLACRSM